jgi:hypothetical protein
MRRGRVGKSRAGKSQEKTVTLEQWVEIEICEGRTVTTLYPPNEEMLKQLKEMDPKPQLVYRRLNFRGSVPPEYHWTTHDEERRANGGHGIQRMLVETWLTTIAGETDGHLGPCFAPMPRPLSRGGCDCPTCTKARDYWERQGITVR